MKIQDNVKNASSIKQRLYLNFLMANIGRTKKDFCCGVASEEKFKVFEDTILIHVPSFYIVCESEELASKVCTDLNLMGFQLDMSHKDVSSNLCVFLYKKPDEGDELYLLQLQQKLEKAKEAFSNYLLNKKK